jgi:hypothetical protein
MDRTALCPGSASAAADVEDVTSEAAAEGTMLHEVMAGIKHDLTPEQGDCIQKCLDYVGLHQQPTDQVSREVKLELMDDEFETILQGTADVVILNEEQLHVIDWKFGRVWVPPGTWQIKAYGLMAMETFERETATVHIFQPRAGQGKAEMVIDRDELKEQILDIIRRAQEQYPSFKAGDHCLYCPAKMQCIAAQALETSLTELPEETALRENPQLVGEMADAAKIVEQRCKAILALCKDMTREGLPTGYKIITRSGKKSVGNPTKVLAILSEFGLTQEAFIRILRIPNTELEKLVIPMLQEIENLSAKDAKTRLWELIEDCVAASKPTELMVKEKGKE